MNVIRTIEDWRGLRPQMGTLGFVPTMGALHDGHLSLIRAAARDNESAALSIFVNPLQFGPHEDFNRYPRTEHDDLQLAEKAGARYAFCPDPAEMTEGISTVVRVGRVSERFEGESRPGHFDGVATIVARLLGIAQADNAYFGLKDLQQCAVIRTMVKDLAIPVELRFEETVRESTGLAMSSRNRYLSIEERLQAAELYRILKSATKRMWTTGEVGPVIDQAKVDLMEMDFEVEYLACIDPLTFEEVGDVNANSRLIVAAKFHGVRLIDNVGVKVP